MPHIPFHDDFPYRDIDEIVLALAHANGGRIYLDQVWRVRREIRDWLRIRKNLPFAADGSITPEFSTVLGDDWLPKDEFKVDE